MARKLKVHYSTIGICYTPVPSIMLKGKWLEAAGFKIGDFVEVVCEGDKITLTKTTPPETKETLNAELMKLTKKEREKLLRMIKEKKQQ